jgi:fructose-1,6-bisphosphatase/inositol monophosphatase family enzyme
LDSSIFDRVSEILRETATAVVMPRFAALNPGDVTMKAVNDPVTIADRESEAMIGRELRLLLPHARIVGEEACAADPALVDNLGDGTVWIVDPIDGTANFAAGRAPFAMMVALLEQGELVGSWILDPLGDRLAVAQRGAGAWIDGERLHNRIELPKPGDLNGIVSEAFLPPEKRVIANHIRAAVGSVAPTARCAGHEYPLVATGAKHFALYWRTLVWDHAPGVLLLNEAGGSASHLDSTPYDPCRPQMGLLLAHNPSISEFLLEAITR